MATPERIHVGWYCDHSDEPPGEGTHMSHHGKFKKKGGWIEAYPEPSTRKSLAFLHYSDPAKLPHCPRAIPVYIDGVPDA